ncbi:hypothetical protein E1B28_006928 [Marasmius oreades]|uniref:Uncharacterized protein n=1 Tax=Marasmius oreades TaxID=181124 RepID=A0A9P7USX2_9AGAR|nr:uncharacterized protein E1B28_006928 [Marasmius oreades]KAG7093242.1 hypothetical protein E1B28_006928 [Marasmius oreades]
MLTSVDPLTTNVKAVIYGAAVSMQAFIDSKVNLNVVPGADISRDAELLSIEDLTVNLTGVVEANPYSASPPNFVGPSSFKTY